MLWLQCQPAGCLPARKVYTCTLPIRVPVVKRRRVVELPMRKRVMVLVVMRRRKFRVVLRAMFYSSLVHGENHAEICATIKKGIQGAPLWSSAAKRFFAASPDGAWIYHHVDIDEVGPPHRERLPSPPTRWPWFYTCCWNILSFHCTILHNHRCVLRTPLFFPPAYHSFHYIYN